MTPSTESWFSYAQLVIFSIIKSEVIPPPVFICSCFKMLLLRVAYMRIFYPLVDVSIHLTPLLGFALNACSKIYIHFVLLFCFKIRIYCRVTMNIGEIIKFYWIMWRPDNGSSKGITLLKSKKSKFWKNVVDVRSHILIKTCSFRLSATGLFNDVWRFSGHQTLKD